MDCLKQFPQQLDSSTDMYWAAGASAGDTGYLAGVPVSQELMVWWENKTRKINISIFPETRSRLQKD